MRRNPFSLVVVLIMIALATATVYAAMDKPSTTSPGTASQQPVLVAHAGLPNAVTQAVTQKFPDANVLDISYQITISHKATDGKVVTEQITATLDEKGAAHLKTTSAIVPSEMKPGSPKPTAQTDYPQTADKATKIDVIAAAPQANQLK